MNIYLTYENDYLCLNYESKYASGSIPVETPQDLVRAIEEVCGKGSYCLYKGKGEEYPEVVNYLETKELEGKFPQITFWQQGVKTSVIEQAREVAREKWGNIPEMRIWWLQNQCRSYIEDII
jgi:hypothetical protein